MRCVVVIHLWIFFLFFLFFLLTISLTRKVLPIVHDDGYDNGNVQQIHIGTDILGVNLMDFYVFPIGKCFSVFPNDKGRFLALHLKIKHIKDCLG